jgi:hypothetical protein
VKSQLSGMIAGRAIDANSSSCTSVRVRHVRVRQRCRIEPYLEQGGAATRHRWPGVSAAALTQEARAAHAGPQAPRLTRLARLIHQANRERASSSLSPLGPSSATRGFAPDPSGEEDLPPPSRTFPDFLRGTRQEDLHPCGGPRPAILPV